MTDLVPKGSEISVSENSILFSGNERGLLLLSEPISARAGENFSFSASFRGKGPLKIGIYLFSNETGEIASENAVLANETSAEAVFEGPGIETKRALMGGTIVSISGISFPEDGLSSVSLSCLDCEVVFVKGSYASLGNGISGIPLSSAIIFALPFLLAIIIAIGFFALAKSREKREKNSRESEDSKKREEALDEIQKSVFGGRN